MSVHSEGRTRNLVQSMHPLVVVIERTGKAFFLGPDIAIAEDLACPCGCQPRDANVVLEIVLQILGMRSRILALEKAEDVASGLRIHDHQVRAFGIDRIGYAVYDVRPQFRFERCFVNAAQSLQKGFRIQISHCSPPVFPKTLYEVRPFGGLKPDSGADGRFPCTPQMGNDATG